MHLSRRKLIGLSAALAALPRTTSAKTANEISWDDLIPADLPYPEIIGEGEMDEINDTWLPVFDENAKKLNPSLDGVYIKLPGYIIPFDYSTDGVTSFMLVPYVGACIHVPPPPPNQLVFVTTEDPWPSDKLWDAVWVTGLLEHEMQTTEIAEVGYALKADLMEIYVWE